MPIEVVSNPSQLSELRHAWSQLTEDAPLHSLAWLTTWWENYANASRNLSVVVWRTDEGTVRGIAPWYREQQGGRRVLRWLGDGRTCTDHTTLFCKEHHREEFSAHLVEWLLADTNNLWTELQLEAIDSDDTVCQRLIAKLTEAGCPQVRHDQPGSCFVDLPMSFDDYLMAISKNHRKRCRRWDKTFYQTGRAQVTIATTPDDCLSQWKRLVDLHNMRRSNVGEQGAFEDAQFADFHRQVIPRLASRQNVQLRVLEVDGQPMAAEYVLQDRQTWYAYQSGMSEAGEAISAGSLSILALVRDAIAAGCQRLDLMRGDEAYKFSWGAMHRPAYSTTIRRPSAKARLLTLKDTALVTAKRMKRSLLS